jgi:hypothetical protein
LSNYAAEAAGMAEVEGKNIKSTREKEAEQAYFCIIA